MKATKKQIHTRLGIDYAIKQYKLQIPKTKQNPNEVTYRKQWDEFRRPKGWMVVITYIGIEEDLKISLDITPYYVRIIGEIDKIPEYIQGEHQRWDFDEKRHKILTPEENMIRMSEMLNIVKI